MLNETPNDDDYDNDNNNISSSTSNNNIDNGNQSERKQKWNNEVIVDKMNREASNENKRIMNQIEKQNHCICI